MRARLRQVDSRTRAFAFETGGQVDACWVTLVLNDKELAVRLMTNLQASGFNPPLHVIFASLLSVPPPPRPDLLLILWPIFFVATAHEDPHLKPRNFTKSVVKGAERVAGVTNAIAHPWPMRRSASAGVTNRGNALEEGFPEERCPWDPPSLKQQVHFARSLTSTTLGLTVLRRPGGPSASRLLVRGPLGRVIKDELKQVELGSG